MQPNWPAINLGLWHRAIFFELQVSADGTIKNSATLPAQWRLMSRDTARCGSALDLTFTLFDEKDFEKLFTAPQSRHRLLQQIIDLSESAKADGVHLDFEVYKPVASAAIAGFRDFLDQLSARLRRDDSPRLLSAFGVIGAAQDLYDKNALSKMDFIVVQGYDAYWAGGPTAGPVAPIRGSHKLTWEKALHHYLRLGAKRSQLLFGIPYYGYEWPTESNEPGSRAIGPGQETTYAPIPPDWVQAITISALEQSKRHGRLRDSETGSPYYVYRDSQGKMHQGWFEDETSLGEKIDFIKREKLAGVAAFPLGYDGGNFDALLRRSFGQRPDCHPADADKQPSEIRK